MKKNRPFPSRPASKPLRASLTLALLSTFLAGGAHAAGPFGAARTVFDSEVSSVNGNQTVLSIQDKDGSVGADAVGQQVGITMVGPQQGSSHTVVDNQVAASATGNTLSNAIDLSLVARTLQSDGAASLGVQFNDAVINSNTRFNSVALDLTGFVAGGASVLGNSIAASTTLNGGASSIAGTVPLGYVSPAFGQSNASNGFGLGGGNLSASGSVVVTSVQQAFGPGSSADAQQNEIVLQVGTVGGSAVTSALALEGNTISATLKGNAATSLADLRAGGAPAFAGSAVVSNLQSLSAGGEGVHTANNIDSAIVAGVYGDGEGEGEGGVGALSGRLSVQGNAITASVTGNSALGALPGVAGNRIVLADGLSFAGAGGGSINHSDAFGGGPSFTLVAADLAIANNQSNLGTVLSSNTGFAQVGAFAQSLQGGTIVLAGNQVTADATGNAASSAFASAQNAASFAGTVALANQQGNFGTLTEAVTGPSMIGAWVAPNGDGTTLNSSVTVSDNRTAAKAYGSSVAQSLALESNTLALGGAAQLVAGTFGITQVDASGAATLTNLQRNTASQVVASNEDASTGLSADSGGASGNTIRGSTLGVTANTQEAVALGTSAANALTLKGTTIGAGAGIASVQQGDGGSTVNATLAGAATSLYAGTHIEDTSLALTGNLQRAIGYGNSASNSLAVTANTVEALPTGALASQADAGPAPGGVVTAGYGLLNRQMLLSAVSATADGARGPVTALNVLLEGNATGSSVVNQGNALVAAGYGNDATNAIRLELGAGIDAVAEDGRLNVANVTNLQGVIGSVTARATGGAAVTTRVDDNVVNSSVSTSGNTIEALALGSRSANMLAVSGNSLTVASAELPLGAINSPTPVVDAPFSVQNIQSGAGVVLASQRALELDAAEMRTSIGGAVAGSTVVMHDNLSSASATSNSATNGLSLEGNTVRSASALQNYQTSTALVTAESGQPGLPGTDGTPAQPFVYSAAVSGLSGTFVGTNATPTAGTLTVATSSLTPSQVTYLQTQGWTLAGASLTRPASSLGTMTMVAYLDMSESSSAPFAAVLPGAPATAATPAQGGVTLAVGAAVSGAQLAVTANTTRASASGNSAANSVTVSANEIAASGGIAIATTGIQAGETTGALADHVLLNTQYATGAPMSTQVYGRFAIDALPGAAIGNSTLAVSDNEQRASAVANTAVNSVALAATSATATSALMSVQSGTSSVNATSELDLSAPGAAIGSSISVSGNRNTALAVVNDVSNTLSVSATTLVPVGGGSIAVVSGGNASGDHVLSNAQGAANAVTSMATTRLSNPDGLAVATGGLIDSSATFGANETLAEASANRASNVMTLVGTATHAASGAIGNTQTASGAVLANASTVAQFGLNGAPFEGEGFLPALNQSGARFEGNTTSALARGNFASNVLNAAGGSGNAFGSAASNGASTQAALAIQNTQTNSGLVQAVSTGSYQVALNAAGPGSPFAMGGSTIGVTGNKVAAEAYGNSATNAVVMTALNTLTPTAAVGNYQSNSGAISAVATSVRYGAGVTGSAMASSARVGGNQVTATAVGNSATSSILQAR